MDRSIRNILLFATSFVMAGCSGSLSNNSAEEKSVGREEVLPRMALNVNSYPLNQLVCDPFQSDETSSLSFENGLKAELYTVEDSSEVGDSVVDYIDRAKKSPFKMFFNRLSFGTQKFVSGFLNEAGGVIHNQLKEIIHEHFAIKLTGSLILHQDQDEGEYEFSMIADDGAVFRIFYEGQWIEVLNGDGSHPTTYSCGITSLSLKKGTSYPVEILYFQARKNSPIAFVALWRQAHPNGKLDPFCGKGRNDGEQFFDEEDHSRPLPAYMSLRARGWKTIKKENFLLPPEEEYNPCSESKQIPEITDFYFSFGDGTVTLQWKTDIPATSQVIYTRSDNGVQVLTESDNILRTTHSITIPKNPSGVSYIIRAISISETLGKTVSGGYTLHSYF